MGLAGAEKLGIQAFGTMAAMFPQAMLNLQAWNTHLFSCPSPTTQD